MLFKVLVLLALLGIAVALFRGMYFLVKGGDSEKLRKALLWRVSLSIALFLLLMLAVRMGWITPHGLQPAAPAASVVR